MLHNLLQCVRRLTEGVGRERSTGEKEKILFFYVVRICLGQFNAEIVERCRKED